MEKKRKQDIITYSVMLMLGLLFYFVPGKWISVEDDSISYISERGREGVLPGYPTFLYFFKSLLSEQFFLSGVVIAQSVLAIICTFLFVLTLKKQLKLKSYECIFLYVLCMLPFSIYLPEVGITHQILTEGITYAIFYLYFITILKAMWSLEYKWYWASMAVALLMGLIRSQMLFLQVICALLLLWITYRKINKGVLNKVLGSILALVVGIIFAFGSYKAIYKVVELDIQKQAEKKMDIEERKADITVRSETSQFDAVIIARGFFEADEADVVLFDDEMMQQIFMRTYQLADENGHRYVYVSDDLYMWQHLVYDGMRTYALQAIDEYDEQFPGMRERSANSIVRELGIKVLLKHFDRYCYHTVRLMMPSFIATVFFQIRPIYLLCHFIALFLYLVAIIFCIYVHKRERNKDIIIFMAAIVITMVIMVVAVNVMFMGLQRYVVYGMGIFYCAMYLLLKEAVSLYRNDKYTV